MIEVVCGCAFSDDSPWERVTACADHAELEDGAPGRPRYSLAFERGVTRQLDQEMDALVRKMFKHR